MSERQSFHMHIRGLLLIGFGMLLFKLLLTGNIENFLAPKMENFMIGTFLVISILGVAQLIRSGKEESACSCCEHNHHLPRRKITSFLLYSLFLIPIVTAFLFSDHILDGSIAAKRGVSLSGEQVRQQQNGTSSSSQSSVATQTVPPSPIQQQPPKGYYEKLEKELMNMQTITIDDTRFISILDVIGGNVAGFKGKNITFMGFVDREPDFKKDEVVVARYGITCCIADASVLGLTIKGNSVPVLKAGEWVKVTGVLDQTTYIDTLLPLVKVTSIEKTAPSKQQYVYQKF